MFRYLFVSMTLLLSTHIADAQSMRLVLRIDSSDYQGNQTVDSVKLFYATDMGLMHPGSVGGAGQWAAEEVLEKTFTTGSGQYEDQLRILQHFDTDARLTSQYFVSPGNGDTSFRFLNYYSNDHYDSLACEIYNSGVFVNSYKESYTYGVNGVEQIFRLMWNSGTLSWDTSRRITFTYNSGQLAERLREDQQGGAWLPVEKYYYTFQGNTLTIELREEYDQVIGWYIHWKNEYSYNVNNDLILKTTYYWNGTTFEGTNRYQYTYDNNHNRLAEDLYLWDGILVPWMYYNSWLYTYNTSNLITQKVHGYWDNSVFYEEQDNWPKSVYFYEEYTPVSVSNTKDNTTHLHVYPNPATGTININMMTEMTTPFSITIFDATGKSVRHWNEAPAPFYQKQVDVSELPAGNYFLRIDNHPQEAVQFTILR